MSGITADATRFNYAVVGLDEESILLMSDIVKSASYTLLKTELIRRLSVVGLDEECILLVSDVVKSASYTLLKTELIRRLSVSESAKLDHLLAGLTLDDRTPSPLLREMRQLGGNKINDDLMKSLWLRRLPEDFQAVLVCVSGSLEALTAAADKVHASSTILAVQKPSDEVGDLRREIAALTASVAEIRATLDAHCAGARSRARSKRAIE